MGANPRQVGVRITRRSQLYRKRLAAKVCVFRAADWCDLAVNTSHLARIAIVHDDLIGLAVVFGRLAWLGLPPWKEDL